MKIGNPAGLLVMMGLNIAKEAVGNFAYRILTAIDKNLCCTQKRCLLFWFLFSQKMVVLFCQLFYYISGDGVPRITAIFLNCPADDSYNLIKDE